MPAACARARAPPRSRVHLVSGTLPGIAGPERSGPASHCFRGAAPSAAEAGIPADLSAAGLPCGLIACAMTRWVPRPARMPQAFRGHDVCLYAPVQAVRRRVSRAREPAIRRCPGCGRAADDPRLVRRPAAFEAATASCPGCHAGAVPRQPNSNVSTRVPAFRYADWPRSRPGRCCVVSHPEGAARFCYHQDMGKVVTDLWNLKDESRAAAATS